MFQLRPQSKDRLTKTLTGRARVPLRIGCPRKVDIAIWTNCSSTRQRPARFRICVHRHRRKSLGVIMRSSHHDRLLMIKSHIYIRPMHREHGFVGMSCRPNALLPPSTRYARSPATAPPSRRACLQPGGVNRLPVHGIDHNLRIKLPGRRSHRGCGACHDTPLSLLTISAIVGAVQAGQSLTAPYCGKRM